MKRAAPQATKADGPMATKLIGDPFEQDGRMVTATFHPSNALRAPDAKTRDAAFRVTVEALRHTHRLIDERRK
jgi:DNA polymerase